MTTIAMYDNQHGWITDCPAEHLANLPEDAELIRVSVPDPEFPGYVHVVHVVRHADGTAFCPSDWQGPQAETAEDVAASRWYANREDQQDAIMLGGLPRIF